jgi:hypothetical protein
MPEHRVDVKPVKVKMLCENCTMRYMKPTGLMKPMHPPLFTHRCENCGYEKDFKQKYPYIEYVEI